MRNVLFNFLMLGNQPHLHCTALMLNYPDENTKNKLVKLADDIIKLKKEDKDTSELEGG